MSLATKQKGKLVAKQNGLLSRITSMANSFRKRRQQRNSRHDNEMSPLEQAKALQQEDRDHNRRGNRKRPQSIPRVFSTMQSESSQQRNQDHKEKRRRRTLNSPAGKKDSQPVNLCNSNSDTDSDNDNKTKHTRSFGPISSKEQKSEKNGSRSFKKYIDQQKRKQGDSNLPSYPRQRLPVEDLQNDENDYMRQTSTSPMNLQDDESDDQSTIVTRNLTYKRGKEEIEIPPGEYDKPSPKKKQRNHWTESYGGFMDLKIPPLKKATITKGNAIFSPRDERRKRRKRYSDDVKDMDDKFMDNQVVENNVISAEEKLIKSVVEDSGSCAYSAGIDRVYKLRSGKVEDTSDFKSESRDMSPSPQRSLKTMRKVNNRSSKGKTKNRKASKVVPGASLIQGKSYSRQQNNGNLVWRNEKDQDEYHTKNNDDEKSKSAMAWDPLTGDSYRNTSSSAVGRSTQQISSLRRSCRKNKKTKTPETIILCSDSEEDAVMTDADEDDKLEFPLKRFVIEDTGKVYNNQDHQPKVMYDTERQIMEISYSKSRVKVNARGIITIDVSGIEEIQFFEKDDNIPELDTNINSFIFVRSDVRKRQATKRMTERQTENKQLVLEFETDQDMHDFRAAAECDYNKMISHVQPEDLEVIASTFVSDSKERYALRNRFTPSEIDTFISNRRDDEILVVYPFRAEKKKIEAAASGLKELSWSEISTGDSNDMFYKNEGELDSTALVPGNRCSDNVLPTLETGQRSHFIEIRVEDYKRLDTGQWLNDSLVDMWMQWISRHVACREASDLHFFTSHFYTTLASDGVDGVKSWTAKKNINIFEKKLIFIPINKTLHWSLCVVINPGAIVSSVDDDDLNGSGDQPLSCMLFFDSLSMHKKVTVQRKVNNWLNSEWQRMKNDPDEKPFSKNSCMIYNPQVPRQNNGSDCGVFVCRYAFAMFQLRHRKFDYKDAGLANRTVRPFSDLITNGEEFDFNVDDIQRIRSDFKTLIKNLHPLYQIAKDDRIKAEKEEKKARKLRKEKIDRNYVQQNLTDEAESDAVDETCFGEAAPSLNARHIRTMNDSCDSAKENRIPMEDQKMQKDVDEFMSKFDPHSTESTQQQSPLETETADIDAVFEDPEDNSPSPLKRQVAEPYVGRLRSEEMADTENMVNF